MSARRSTQNRHRRLVEQVTSYIAGHLDEPLDLASLGRIAELSPHHFQRVFKQVLGESPKQYVRRLRLERSTFLLRQPGVSVIDVAFDSGYESHEAFTRAFHDRFGVPPRRYQTQADGVRRETTDPFEIVSLERTRLASVPFVGPYDSGFEAFARLADWAAPLGLLELQNMIGASTGTIKPSRTKQRREAKPRSLSTKGCR